MTSRAVARFSPILRSTLCMHYRPISITRTCCEPDHEPGFATRFAASSCNGNWTISAQL